MTLSYPVVTKEAMDVLAFNGYYNGSDLTKEGSEEDKRWLECNNCKYAINR